MREREHDHESRSEFVVGEARVGRKSWMEPSARVCVCVCVEGLPRRRTRARLFYDALVVVVGFDVVAVGWIIISPLPQPLLRASPRRCSRFVCFCNGGFQM